MARRLVAAALVAAGLALEVGPGLALVVAGLGWAWSGIELGLAAGVNRYLLGRRKGTRGASIGPPLSWTAAPGPDDHPAPAASTETEAA